MVTYILAGVVIAIVIGVVISSKKEKEDKSAKRAETIGGANVTNDLSRVYPGGVFELPSFGNQLTPIETYVTSRKPTNLPLERTPGTSSCVITKGENSM